MDLVLEVFDTLVLDRFYASIAPLPEKGVLASAVDAASNMVTGSNNGTTVPFGADVGAVSKICSALTYLDRFGKSDRYGLTEPQLLPMTEWTFRSILGRENIVRQSLSLLVITTVFGWLLYFIVAALSYQFVYDPENFKHPKYLKNQVAMEIYQASSAIPVMTALTVPWFVAEAQGFSKLYWDPSANGGWWYMALQFPLFLVFTDCLIYMIHRALHHPLLYRRLHKPHHKWIVPTPFASHAFHPVDGYMQSLPYHIFPFVFPLHKISYVFLFMIVNIWTVMIHDGEYLAHDPVVNGSACHTVHHLYFNYNYGQYTTLWDRLGGSYRLPDQELYDKSRKNAKSTIDKEVGEMERILKEVEGSDDRVYASAQEQAASKVQKR